MEMQYYQDSQFCLTIKQDFRINVVFSLIDLVEEFQRMQLLTFLVKTFQLVAFILKVEPL